MSISELFPHEIIRLRNETRTRGLLKKLGRKNINSTELKELKEQMSRHAVRITDDLEFEVQRSTTLRAAEDANT